MKKEKKQVKMSMQDVLAKIENLMTFLDAPAPQLLGLDMSATSIKMVELQKKRNGEYAVLGYAIEPMPKDCMAEGGVVNMEELAAAIAKCHKKTGSKVKNVAIGLPPSLVVSKKIKVPGSMDIEDEELILAEANQAIPFPLQEVNIDWALLGPTPGSEDFNDIMLTVARKVKIEDRVAAVEMAGLKAVVVDVENMAIRTASLLATKTTMETYPTVAIVEAGYTSMRICVYQNGVEAFSKEIPTGSQALTENISTVYGISMEEAEYAKRNKGENLEGYNDNALHPFLDGLAMEISRAIQFYLTQATVEQVDAVFLCGGCALLQDSCERIQDIVNIPTLIANPLSNMEKPSRISIMAEQDAPLLLTAVGLAMRKFD